MGKKPKVQTTRAPCTTPTVDEHTLDQLAELLKEKLETPSGDLPHVQYVARRGWKAEPSWANPDDARGSYQSYSRGRGAHHGRGWSGRGGRSRQNTQETGCFICDSREHLQFNCPYRTHCHRCLQPGHIAKHCEATTPTRARRGGSIATLTTEVRGLILTDLQIREKTYPFLVDTGAEVSLIPTSIPYEIGLPIRHGCTRRPVMVDGTSIRCDGTANANVRLGQKQITHSFYVVPDIGKGILGMDALSHLDVKIDTGSGQLTIDGHEVPGSAWESAERKSLPISLVKYSKIHAIRSGIIPPNQECVLWGSVCGSETGNWTGIVEVTPDVTE